jgi:Omp85 superfamily domain
VGDTRRRLVRLAAAALFVLGAAGRGSAQTKPDAPAPKVESSPISMWTLRPAVGEAGEPAGTRIDEAPANPSTPKAKGAMEFVVAPLPVINPTLDNGIALVVGVLYPVQTGGEDIRPSGTFVTGLKTSNDSWMLGGGQMLHLDRDRYRVLAVAGYADINFDFFGIGSDAGEAGQSIPIRQFGYAGLGQFLVRAFEKVYIGARYRLSRMAVESNLDLSGIAIPAGDVRLRTAVLGPHFERDARDNQFYPRTGSLIDFLALFGDESVGGRRTYQLYQAAYSSYFSVNTRQVVASRINACGATGDVPFYDLCMIGQFQDLRGYPTGQYRDRRLLSGQAEYRIELWRRLGVVAFGGAGTVAETLDAFNTHDVLPTGGAGLRLRLTKVNHVNLRVDYAWGRRSNALYVSVGEAF